MGITFINKFYKFSAKDLPESENDFIVMSYNVRLFNLFDWISKDVTHEDSSLYNDKNRHFVHSRIFHGSKYRFESVSHRYIFMQGNKIKTGQAIFLNFQY